MQTKLGAIEKGRLKAHSGYFLGTTRHRDLLALCNKHRSSTASAAPVQSILTTLVSNWAELPWQRTIIEAAITEQGVEDERRGFVDTRGFVVVKAV